MSIDFLFELERIISSGQEVYACPAAQEKKWVISRSFDDVKKQAQRVAANRKQAVDIVRLVPYSEVMPGEMFIVPVGIDAVGPKGEPNIRWSTVESKEAAEMMRDVREGPSPFFGLQVYEQVAPAGVG